MKLVTWILLASCQGWLSAAHELPDLVATRSYSVTMPLPDGMWAVEVFKEADVVRYSYADEADRRSVVFHLTVFRVRLPVDCATTDEATFVKRLIHDDGLNYQRHEFGKKFYFRFAPDRLEIPCGRAYIYSSEGAVVLDPVAHYADVALVLPRDYRVRQVGYLVVGHQMKSNGTITRQQRVYLELILKGLKEASYILGFNHSLRLWDQRRNGVLAVFVGECGADDILRFYTYEFRESTSTFFPGPDEEEVFEVGPAPRARNG